MNSFLSKFVSCLIKDLQLLCKLNLNTPRLNFRKNKSFKINIPNTLYHFNEQINSMCSNFNKFINDIDFITLPLGVFPRENILLISQ